MFLHPAFPSALQGKLRAQEFYKITGFWDHDALLKIRYSFFRIIAFFF